MSFQSNSIRAFIGSKDFLESRAFYLQLGFEEVPLGPKMSYFKANEKLGFYLQDYYVKDWVENTMLFLEVNNLENCYRTVLEKNLTQKFNEVRISKIKKEEWGSVFFVHDPSGILWHFGTFNPKQDSE